MEKITTSDIEQEDWSSCRHYPENEVVCTEGHNFWSHSKFSGKLVAIISRRPCPDCGTHALHASYGSSERQTLDNKDVGNLKGDK